jgi:hypothetical protein
MREELIGGFEPTTFELQSQTPIPLGYAELLVMSYKTYKAGLRRPFSVSG